MILQPDLAMGIIQSIVIVYTCLSLGSTCFRDSSIDLQTGIEQAGIALNLFLNNHYQEAKDRMAPWSVYCVVVSMKLRSALMPLSFLPRLLADRTKG